MIIVGAGNLGQALANYQSFNEDYGYKVMALFDVNPKLIGISVRGVKVLDTDELENFIKTHGIKIAALTIRRIRHLRSQRRWQNGELKDSGILHRSIFIYQIMLQ